MKKTGISNDTWEEEAVQRIKWRGLLRKATSAVEGQRQQEYQRAHVRRHSTATSSSFQCNNRQRYCGSRAGLTAHARACLRQAATQIYTRQSSSATKDSHYYLFGLNLPFIQISDISNSLPKSKNVRDLCLDCFDLIFVTFKPSGSRSRAYCDCYPIRAFKSSISPRNQSSKHPERLPFVRKFRGNISVKW